MRARFFWVVVILVVLGGLMCEGSVDSRGGDQSFTANTVEQVSLTFAKTVKDGATVGEAEISSEPVASGLDNGFEIVSIIVTFDESYTVDPNAMEVVSGGQVVHKYSKILNGVSMVLAGDKVNTIEGLKGVKKVYLDELRQLDTDTSPGFVGATSAWEELGGQGSAGEGVTVGVLDTGIWPEHPSFSDADPFGKLYAPPPVSPGLNGFGLTGPRETCDFGDTDWNPNDEPFACNNKLIGAYDFMDTYKAVTGLVPYDTTTNTGEYDSARDSDGHGTHTASTAAGNGGVEAVMLGAPRGLVSGIAPRAHVIMFKVCGSLGCYTSDSVAAIEQAILDEVDTINFSISGGNTPYSDAAELAFLAAYDSGVFVAASAGNSGPSADTVAHRGPWTMTVGASTHDRTYAASVTVTDGIDSLTLEGASITGSYTGDIVLAADYDEIALGDPNDGLCLEPFPVGTFEGQVVVCQRGVIARVTKSYNVAEGGAGGMILYNPVLQGLSTDPHYVPSIHIENDAGFALLDFLSTHTDVEATLSGGVETPAQGDMMAAFSSRGGPGQTLGVSKPDITAPGVQILAGNTPLGVEQGPGGMGPFGELFQAIGGTSMSGPHIAGAGALIKAMHPDWTPGQIKSALMTTALTVDVVKEDGTPGDAFDYGSGRVDLASAGDPGLTISATGQDFLDHEADLWNANYPSLYVPIMPGRIVVQRTVHSELPYPSLWRTSVDSPEDLKIVVPGVVLVQAGGDQTLNIDIDARDVPLGEVRHAILTLTARRRVLTFPITIVRRQPAVTLENTCDPATFPRRETTNCTITISNNSFSEATVDLYDWLPNKLRLVRGSVVGGDSYGWMPLVTYNGTLQGAEPPTVTVVDGTGTTPAGYLPLSIFGIAPIDGVGDETIVNFAVPPFVYAGQTYEMIGMVSNGYAVVGGGDGADVSFENQTLPEPAQPNNVLAPFWTDLNPEFGGEMRAGTLTDGVTTWMILDWEAVQNYGDGEPNSFQIWIAVDTDVEDISFAYGDVSDGDNGFLTVGAENSYGNSGQNWYINGAGTPVAAGSEVRVESVPGEPGETHVIEFTAMGRRLGGWKNCAYMTGDLFAGTNITCFSGEVANQ
ncbi:MAG: S8 family serine peptidase [Proteobacteria bacterium]|nr:S8 family serine peptidase [Pseudomonadota bacterium]